MFDCLFQIIAATNAIKIAGIIFFGFMVLIYVLMMQAYGNLWLQARLSGAPISFAELVGMTLRKVNAKIIITSRITAVQAGLSLSTAQLESHYLAGGNVSDVVRAMIILDKAGINPGWETLTREDLLGRDVLGEAQLTAEKIITNRSMLEMNQNYVEVDEISEIE